MKSMKTFLILVIPSQIMLLGCSFYLINRVGYDDTVFNAYIKINYEVMKLDSITLIVNDPDSYPILKLIPWTIPIFSVLYLMFKTLFISCLIYEIIKKSPKSTSLKEVCNICDAPRKHIEEQGLNFSNHIEREHNIWSYIYFFIYVRRQKDEQLVDHSLIQKVGNGELQLLKLSTNFE